jgi:hypothetical protein
MTKMWREHGNFSMVKKQHEKAARKHASAVKHAISVDLGT